MRILVISHAPSSRSDRPAASTPNPALAQWNSYASPGTQVELGSPEPYARPDPNRNTGGTDRRLLWHVSVPAIVQKTVWAEQNGYDAVIQSNNFEHGVEASRLAVRIPVLGLCRTTMHVAANLADRIGVTVPLDGYFVLARHLLESYGLQHYVSGMRSLGFEDVPLPDQIPALRPAMFERTVEVMRALVKETGAECIVPLGGAVIPSILDPQELEREVGAPVLNPRPIALRTAEMYVDLGLSQSPLTYTRAMFAPEDAVR
jgi:allantoin racemase